MTTPSRELIDVPIELDKETIDALNKMTKKELVERLGAAAIEAHVSKLRTQTALEDIERLESETKSLKERLAKAEEYVEQGRAMLESIMERWYHYD